jgi:hypothetical protein
MQSHPNNNFQQTNKYNYDPQDEHSTQDESSGTCFFFKLDKMVNHI